MQPNAVRAAQTDRPPQQAAMTWQPLSENGHSLCSNDVHRKKWPYQKLPQDAATKQDLPTSDRATML